jgi:cytochrome c-type biogenesis protein CcmH/NrfG
VKKGRKIEAAGKAPAVGRTGDLPAKEEPSLIAPKPPAPQPLLPEETWPFFQRIDWAAFWTSCLAAFAVYVYTLAPSVTLEDSGELATAGTYLGIPHPPGYPSWTMLVWLFTKIFWFVKFRGHPNPAWSIALASAVCGALASGMTAILICRSGRDFLRGMQRTTEVLGIRTEKGICWAGGVASSLLFAFSPVEWSQAVIVEVYALNAFFLVLILLVAYMWIRRPNDKLMIVTGFLFGLGLTNYQALLILLPALIVVVVVKDLPLFRDFAIFGFPYVVVLFLISSGRLPPIVHPLHVTCYVYLALNFIAMTLAYFFLPRGRTVALTMLGVQLGLLFYAYMPIASDFNPPMNWGYPRTWEGFKHAITRGQYEKIVPTDIFSRTFINQLGDYFSDLRMQFTMPIALLGFLPFAVWSLRAGQKRYNALLVASIMAATAAVLVAIGEVQPAVEDKFPAIITVYRLLALGVGVLVLIGGTALALNEIRDLWERLWSRSTLFSLRAMTALILLGLLGIGLFYAGNLFKVLIDPHAQVSAFERVGLLALIVGPLAVAGCVLWLMRGRHELAVEIDQDSQKWMIATTMSFLTMSILFTVLANPKGDLQDMFIQKVKFISSHALYAFLIGYGIVFGLALTDTLFRGNRLVKGIGIAFVLMMPLVPIAENYFNKELVRVLGGAEQNGHDFGWQFGNYQLRGAESLLEELSPDEEPIPNPVYPPEMGPDAVFFGGTDPGRFVPTYMIFCPRVRPDVFLITQNALADNTYMSVMRDLYGDAIWIPSVRDGNSAFQRYIEDVRAGKIPASADIKIENGRVSVQGVGGVMLINGILAQMIFEHNRYRHAFYVEESYVIQWMYPYLSPHGLIMKINRDVLPAISEENVRDDLDFWDWYTRRLTGQVEFQRDVVARKSFSKLRSAIAGLYAVRGLVAQAETAFGESLKLYPLSPEANFRLADLLMRINRMEDAYRIMLEFAHQDPGNSRAFDFIRDIKNRMDLLARRKELEDKLTKGPTDVNTVLELGDAYRRLGMGDAFAALSRNIVDNPQVPPVALIRVAQMCAEEKRFDVMAAALDKYLGQVPADVKGWLDLAAVRVLLQSPDEAIKALNQAVRVGGDEVIRMLKEDKRFDPIRRHEGFQRLFVHRP